jgi:hypothetical protein
LLLVQQALQPAQAIRLHHLGKLLHVGRGRAWPRAVLERVGLRESHLAHDVERRLEVRLRFSGKADDNVGRKRNVRPRPADAVDQAEIIAPRVFAIHGREDAVGPGLEG